MCESKLPDTSNVSARTFNADDLKTVKQHVVSARAIVRTIALAVKAQLDGSINYESDGAERWQPVVDLATTKFEHARSLLTEKRDAPLVDWYTPHCLLEAMGAALWHGHTRIESEQLDGDELDTMAQVAIELFDSLMLELEAKEVNHG